MIKNNIISFFKVPFVCNMASNIGCGSRSKPLLLDLENDENIKEAWLNRKGTIIAVVWNNGIDTAVQLPIINSIFSKNGMAVNSIDFNSETQSFPSESKNWYKGSNVDKLSREEALTVANQIIKGYNNINPLKDIQKEKLQNEIVNILYDFFLTFDTFNQLSDTNTYRKLMIKVTKSSEKFVNKENIPNVEKLLISFQGHSENYSNPNCC